jgi:arylsulfatase A-like enzyme
VVDYRADKRPVRRRIGRRQDLIRENEMDRLTRQGLLAVLLAQATAFSVLGTSSALAESPKARRPNILYLFTDDQSIRSVSCYPEAHTWVDTPNIDRLAEQGVRFTHCYTGAWCMPSRATALTGRLPHGIESMRMVGRYPGSTYDPDKCPFWPAVFREHGYFTGMIGKWHTGADTGHGRDWDYSAIWDHTQPKIYGGYYTGQKISFNGAAPEPVGGYSTDNYTRYAVEFIAERAKEPSKPWYLWLCYDAVHGPYTPASRHRDAYQSVPPVAVPTDIFPPRPDKPSYMKHYGVWKKGDDGRPVGLDKAVRKYNRAVRAVDEGVGKVLRALKQTGQLEKTLIVFTSDQGFAWGQHGFAWKYAPYDANLRAPLIVRLPGKVAENKVCRRPVGGQDLIPTFFAVAEIPLPWEMHGRALTPLLKDPEVDWDHPVLMENTKYYYGKDTQRSKRPGWNGVPWWVFLRKGKYKYIRTLVENEVEELYDLQDDPAELVNLALEPEYRATVLSFRQQLIDELRRTRAGMVENLPPVRALPE